MKNEIWAVKRLNNVEIKSEKVDRGKEKDVEERKQGKGGGRGGARLH